MKKHSSYSLYALIAVSSLGLSSCQLPSSATDVMPADWNWGGNVNTPKTPHSPPVLKEQTTQHSSTSSNAETKIIDTEYGKQTVVIPASYYLAKGHPVSHQSADNAWVDKQDSTGYTVQLASGSAPAVAQTLQSAPKDQRMAQVQYDANGQPTYIGVYGTYESKEAAQKALAQLPQNLQSSATVQSWSNVQEKIQSSSTIAPPEITSSNMSS